MAKLVDRLKTLSAKLEKMVRREKKAAADQDSEKAKEEKPVVLESSKEVVDKPVVCNAKAENAVKPVVQNAKAENAVKPVVQNAKAENAVKPVVQNAKADEHVRIVVHDVKEESPAAPNKEDLPEDLKDIDLSDPNALELLLDDGEEEGEEDLDERARLRLDAEKTLLSVELSYQKGIEVVGDRICVPGRVPLMPVSLLEILFIVIGFSAGLIHFSVVSPNYLLSLFVVVFILLVQVIIYHSAYRAMRIVMTVIQTLGTLGIMTFVGWAYYDLLVYPADPEAHRFLLGVAFVSFLCIPLLMLLHLVFLGRSHRWIEIKKKKKKSAQDIPTVQMKTAENTPTKQIKTPANSE